MLAEILSISGCCQLHTKEGGGERRERERERERREREERREEERERERENKTGSIPTKS